MERKIDVIENLPFIIRQLQKGVLLTVKNNCITIGWGQIGIEWNKLIFSAYIRNDRYTHDLLKDCNEFSVNIPLDDSSEEIIKFCGKYSGRNIDKIKELKLHTNKCRKIKGIGIKECPMTLECKIIYCYDQQSQKLDESIKNRFYPQDNLYHSVYYAEIVDAYIIE